MNGRFVCSDYVQQLKHTYKKHVSTAKYIYLYCHQSHDNWYTVDKVYFRHRKEKKGFITEDVPHKDILIDDSNNKYPKSIYVQCTLNPFNGDIYEL